jgi:hypothetical protein
MNVRAVSVPLAASLLLLVPVAAPAATVLDGTSWSVAGNETTKFPKHKPVVTPVSGLVVSFDANGMFRIDNSSIANYGGTFAGKGKRGFQATLDAAATTTYRDYLVQAFETVTGATGTNVAKFKASIQGAVSKDGQTIVFTTKAKMSGTAMIGGKTKKGSVTDKGTFSGPQASGM